MYTREQFLDAIESCLDGIDQKIIARFGIKDGIPMSLSEIESRFGVSRQQVREIEKKVLNYLKTYS